MILPKKRGLSGVYFRFNNPETKKWENRAFEDLPVEEQLRVIKRYNHNQLGSLALILAGTLQAIGNQFDLTTKLQDDETDNTG